MTSTLIKVEDLWVIIIKYEDGSRNDYRFNNKAAALAWVKTRGIKLIDATGCCFSRELRQARKAAKLTQQGMADRMEIPRRTIQDWEADRMTPPPYVQRFVLNELESLKK